DPFRNRKQKHVVAESGRPIRNGEANVFAGHHSSAANQQERGDACKPCESVEPYSRSSHTGRIRQIRRRGQIRGWRERTYPPGLGEAEGAGALCSCCAGCGEAPAPSASAFGGFGPPGGGIVPGVDPPIGSPGGRCVGAGGVVCVPASSARSFSHAWYSCGV